MKTIDPDGFVGLAIRFPFGGCAGMQKARIQFKTPEVTLSHAEVPSYFGIGLRQ